MSNLEPTDSAQSPKSSSLFALLHGIATALVTDKGSVHVDVGEDEGSINVTLFVAESDLAVFSGAENRTVRSIRTVLSAISRGKQISLDVRTLGSASDSRK
jgi:predicted RNA-binding protein YlqC (UPF0109 family)